MQAIIEGPVHLEKASYTILTFVVLRPGKPPHDAAGSEWFVVDSILKLGANDGVIFLEDLWFCFSLSRSPVRLLRLRS